MSGIPIWAVPGAKVVCVNDDISLSINYPHDGNMGGLTRNCIYTIGRAYWDRNEAIVVLVEIVRRNDESGFLAARFRPLVTRSQEQDIGLFRHHLDDVGVDA